jgi:hypothetical protein
MDAIKKRRQTHESLSNRVPEAGIRPCIDGRRNGVREGLEDQTMGMAKSAARLISENLRYPDGTPVEVVIADTTIGGVAEASRCQRKFEEQGVQVTLSVSPCWCYSTEVMDFDPQTIKAVWGFNGTERPGAVFLAAVLAAHTQKGLPAHNIYGRDVQDAADTRNPGGRPEKNPAVCKVRHRREVHAPEQLFADRLDVHGHRRQHPESGHDLSLLRTPQRIGGRNGDPPPHRQGHLRSGRIPARARLDERVLQRGPR